MMMRHPKIGDGTSRLTVYTKINFEGDTKESKKNLDWGRNRQGKNNT